MARAKGLNHTLKGLAGNIGARDAIPLLDSMEKWLETAPVAATPPPVLADLEACLGKIAAGIENTLLSEERRLAAPRGDASRDSAKIKRLLQLLAESDMEAVECFDLARDALQKEMDPETFLALKRLIGRFEFLTAARLLAEELQGK